MKYTKIIIVAIYVASLTLGFKTVYAQQNVSCNNSYYINQNYVDVKVPTTNATYTLQFFMRSDYYTKAIVKDGTTVLTTVQKTPNDSPVLFDSRSVTAGKTIRYELAICPNGNWNTCVNFGGWMPSNIGQYQNYCGTGCPKPEGGNFVVINSSPLYTLASANNATIYDLSLSGYSLFNYAQRQKNTSDVGMVCWNDNPGAASNDFNDAQSMWSFLPLTTVTPTPSPSPSPSVSTTAAPSASPSASPIITHPPADTGFDESFMIYAGAALYAIGIIAFMSAQAFQKKGVIG